MAADTQPKPSSLDKWLLGRIQRSLGNSPIRVRLGMHEDSSVLRAPCLATMTIRDRATLARLVLNPEMAFGDGYTDGSVEIEGDLIAFLERAYLSSRGRRLPRWARRVAAYLQTVTFANSLRGSRKSIHQHYDIRADFYKLWLDAELVYTCAYFPSASASLEQAQTAKLDYVCRKLQLQPGEHVIEAGCGWGALALHMARHYGVTVRAFNISREQILFARERAAEQGLSRRVEFIEDDFRNISGTCDAFASVGMVEHLGPRNYRALGDVINAVLSDAGRGFVHFIGRNQTGPFSPWIRTRIFPGAYIPTLRQVMDIFEPWNLSVLDVENLRLHYAKTLEQWFARYESASAKVVEMFGSEFLRAWRLYLAGSAAAFRVGGLQLFQILFSRTAWLRAATTRAHLYTGERLREQEAQWSRAMS